MHLPLCASTPSPHPTPPRQLLRPHRCMHLHASGAPHQRIITRLPHQPITTPPASPTYHNPACSTQRSNAAAPPSISHDCPYPTTRLHCSSETHPPFEYDETPCGYESWPPVQLPPDRPLHSLHSSGLVCNLMAHPNTASAALRPLQPDGRSALHNFNLMAQPTSPLQPHILRADDRG